MLGQVLSMEEPGRRVKGILRVNLIKAKGELGILEHYLWTC